MDSFHCFPRLPPELRLMIWELCLPHRILEEDTTADFLLDGHESRQACYTRHTTRQNSAPPVIARVSSEARQVALQHGNWVDLYSCEIRPPPYHYAVWLQPRSDLLHTNWSRMGYEYLGQCNSDLNSPIDFLLYRADELGMQASVIAEMIYPFILKGVLDGAEPYPHDSEASPRPRRYPSPLPNEEVAHLAQYLKECHGTLDIAMAAVSLHITKKEALRSGLFGLLGDAPIQKVDVGDQARLRKFHALYREHAFEKEPAVQTLFELFAGSPFQAAVEEWKRHAQRVILANMWKWDRNRNLDILADSGSAWIPYAEEKRYSFGKEDIIYFTMNNRTWPNEDHPWVKQARQKIPKLRPWIMVRCCTEECYMKGPPDEEYWPF